MALRARWLAGTGTTLAEGVSADNCQYCCNINVLYLISEFTPKQFHK